MFREDVTLAITVPQSLVQLLRQAQLLPQPERYASQELSEPARRVGEVRLEQAIEFEQRLIVKSDVREVFWSNACCFEAVVDGVRREARVVLDARETLFLRSRDDDAVANDGRGAVVIEGGDA